MTPETVSVGEERSFWRLQRLTGAMPEDLRLNQHSSNCGSFHLTSAT